MHKVDISGVYFTRDGKTWFGTSDGLASFDGNDFKVYPVSNKSKTDLVPERVLAFAEDQQGFIWVYSSRLVLLKFDPKTAGYEQINFLKNHKVLNGKLTITSLVFDKDNKLWMGAGDFGFFVYEVNTGMAEHYNLDNSKRRIWQSRYGNSIRGFLQDPNDPNLMWISGYGSGIHRFNKKTKTLTKQFRAAQLKDSVWRNCSVTQMAINDTIIWFGTWGTGVGEYNINTGKYKMYPKNAGYYTEMVGTETYTHGHIVTQLIPISKIEYMVALRDSLPAVFNTVTKKFYYLNDAQLNRTINTVTSIGVDNSDNTWFLKGGKLFIASPGYNQFKPLNFVTPHQRESYSGIGDVLLDSIKKLFYIGVNYGDGIFTADEELQLKKLIPLPHYSGNGIVNASSVWKIRRDKTQRLWTLGHIFCVYDSAKNKMILAQEKFPSIHQFKKKLLDFTIDTDGNLLLLSDERELLFFNVENFKIKSIPLPPVTNGLVKKIKGNLHTILVDARASFVYACDGQQIFQYNKTTGNFKTVDLNKAEGSTASPLAITSFALDFDGNLWVGAQGIFIFEPSRFTLVKTITAEDQLTDNLNIRLLQGPPGFMFFFTSKGGNLYSLVDSTFIHFDISNGMLSETPTSICFAGDKLFLNIGYYTGLNQYASIGSLNVHSKKVIPYVSTISVMNQNAVTDTIPEFLSGIKLRHNQNSISFSWSSVEFQFPERVEYAYKLDGIESEWTNRDYMNRSVTYTNLPPGNYNFRIRARMLGGKWTEQRVPLHIVIVPAFWQTWWFVLLCMIAAASVIYFVIRARIVSIQKKEAQRVAHERELFALEAQALRAQMNPHFIFNCLNSIKALIQKDQNDTASSYLTTFSKLIRTLFQNSDQREVTLHDEIETCKLYIQLEAMRFQNKVSFSFDVDEHVDLKDIKVPALILQPFIENAIWHGLVPKQGGGHVNVAVRESAETIRCVVDDDGIGRELSKQYKAQYNTTHESKGIMLTLSRLKIDGILNGREESIEIVDKHDPHGNATGTTVTITFKK